MGVDPYHLQKAAVWDSGEHTEKCAHAWVDEDFYHHDKFCTCSENEVRGLDYRHSQPQLKLLLEM